MRCYRDSYATVSKNDDRCATCFMRTRSEEPYRANCCARYPLAANGVGEYMVSSVMRSHASRVRQCFYPWERFTTEPANTVQLERYSPRSRYPCRATAGEG